MNGWCRFVTRTTVQCTEQGTRKAGGSGNGLSLSQSPRNYGQSLDVPVLPRRTKKRPPAAERAGRAMYHETEDAFERLRVDGYL